MKNDGLTIRIPRFVLFAVLALLLAGGGVAAYLILHESETCFAAESGAEVGCDEDGALSEADYEEQQAQEAEAEAEAAREREEAQARADKCERQLGPLLTDLRELDSRLSVGLSYDEYTNQVGDVQVTYDQVPFNGLEIDCLSDVGIPLESALNDHAKAAGAWGDCIEDLGCDMDSVDPELQRRWSSASGEVEQAGSGLRGLAKP